MANTFFTLRVLVFHKPRAERPANTFIGLVGASGPVPQIGILRLADPLHPEDCGFSGAYVGLIS